MKTLVVYYSRTGNTRKAGKKIAGMLNADVEEIVDLKDRSGILGYMLSGRDASLNRQAEIKTSFDASLYDLVVVGTPVWAFTVSSPVRTYLLQNKDKFRELAFFCTQGGSGGKRAFKAMEQLSGKKPAAVLELNEKEAVGESGGIKIKKFADELKSA
ncbi:MAG: hypothetical protein FJY77_05405 [Candidatus Altiarchaeales archaeon]|nr:hypothetical protein [Candidatus Altiarchaeales archaeon]